MLDEVIEYLRNPLIVMSFTFAFLFCVVSGSQQIGEAVDGEFRAFRLQQYEINGNLFGSRSNRVQFEAVTLNSKNLRRCVVTTWRQLLDKDIDDVLSATAGAVLVFIPSDLDSLSAEDVKAFGQFEKKLLRVRTDLSIYFSPSSSETPSIVSNLVNTPSGQSATATEQLFNTLTADTVQISTIDTSAPESLTYKPKNVVGFLSSGDPSAPTIAFVAHYDSHAVAPGLAAGSDSNGSGIVALLELLAVLGKFYDSTTTRPPYNLLFLWTAGGKLNYQGAMHWINEYQKGTEDQKLELAICLEAIGRARDGTLRMHASTDPKSATANFLKRLTSVANGKKIEVVKKKISLSNVSSWEHEKFNIKRMPAITLSTLPNAFDESRTSLLDIPAKLDVDELASNIRIIAEATLSYILELPEQGSTDSRVTSDKTMLARDAIDKTRIHHYVRQFASKPRPLSDKHATLATSANIAAAAGTFAHVTTSAVTITDARVYSGIENTLISERVKPAVFELVIMSGIMAYLSFFYFITSNAQSLIASASFQIKKALC